MQWFWTKPFKNQPKAFLWVKSVSYPPQLVSFVLQSQHSGGAHLALYFALHAPCVRMGCNLTLLHQKIRTVIFKVQGTPLKIIITLRKWQYVCFIFLFKWNTQSLTSPRYFSLHKRTRTRTRPALQHLLEQSDSLNSWTAFMRSALQFIYTMY